MLRWRDSSSSAAPSMKSKQPRGRRRRVMARRSATFAAVLSRRSTGSSSTDRNRRTDRNVLINPETSSVLRGYHRGQAPEPSQEKFSFRGGYDDRNTYLTDQDFF